MVKSKKASHKGHLSNKAVSLGWRSFQRNYIKGRNRATQQRNKSEWEKRHRPDKNRYQRYRFTIWMETVSGTKKPISLTSASKNPRKATLLRKARNLGRYYEGRSGEKIKKYHIGAGYDLITKLDFYL